jgi:hypothetical protein
VGAARLGAPFGLARACQGSGRATPSLLSVSRNGNMHCFGRQRFACRFARLDV